MDPDAIRVAVTEARKLLDAGLLLEARASLRRLVSSIEHADGSSSAALLEPLCILAEAESRAHPWNVFAPEARSALERALGVALAVANARAETRIREQLAIALHASGESAEAARHMELVVSAKELAGLPPIVRAHSVNALAEMHLGCGAYEEAIERFESSLVIVADSSDELMRFSIHFGLGRAFLGQGTRKRAVTEFEEAYRLFVGMYGDGGRRAEELRALLEEAQRTG